MLSHTKKTINVLLLVASLAFPSAVHSLPDDRAQNIHVKADSAERDEKQGITRYKGDVVIDQGSLNIVADEVVIYGKTDVDRIVATGNPARLRQQPEIDKGEVTAHGNRIEYMLASEVVKLLKNAYIEQEGMKLKGNEITYDMIEQKMSAAGEAEQRVEIVIPPNKTAAMRSRNSEAPN